MALLLLFLLLVLIVFGLSVFTIHLLWVLAVIMAIFWLAGFAFRTGSGGGRWYHW
jgi:hypothetical protein